MRVSAKKANATTTDVILEIRMTEEEAKLWPGRGLRQDGMAPYAPFIAAQREVLKEHLQTRFRVSRVVGQ
jgi:hypothetical protein